LVGIDTFLIFQKEPPNEKNITEFSLIQKTKELDFLYCFKVQNIKKDITHLFDEVLNYINLKLKFLNPELFKRANSNRDKSNEREFENRSMAGMSRLTKKILLSIDYEWVCSTRNKNFYELHEALKKFNQLSPIIDADSINGPMIYPYLCNMKYLKEHLHKNNIFTPTYWPHISKMGLCSNIFESYLSDHLIPLPIDQRYGRRDMHRIIDVIKECNG